MRGIVEDYDENSKIGYIKGYDDDLYLFRQRNVKNNEKLEKGDIVEFDYTRYNLEEMPIAEEIRKEN